MIEYVLGFAFSTSGYVALIEKKRPEWQIGFLNGIGGHIEPTEHPYEAMVREFEEETGVHTEFTQWVPLVQMNSDGATSDWRMYVYKTILPAEQFTRIKTTTDEKIQIVDALDLKSVPHLVPNLKYLIPMALDCNFSHATILTR